MSIFKKTNTKVNTIISLGLSKKLASVMMCVGAVCGLAGGIFGFSGLSYGMDHYRCNDAITDAGDPLNHGNW
jgi:hypothetical protein